MDKPTPVNEPKEWHQEFNSGLLYDEEMSQQASILTNHRTNGEWRLLSLTGADETCLMWPNDTGNCQGGLSRKWPVSSGKIRFSKVAKNQVLPSFCLGGQISEKQQSQGAGVLQNHTELDVWPPRALPMWLSLLGGFTLAWDWGTFCRLNILIFIGTLRIESSLQIKRIGTKLKWLLQRNHNS